MLPGLATGAGSSFTGSSRADSAAEAVGSVNVSGGNIHFAQKNNWLGIAALIALSLVSVAAIASLGRK